MAELNPEGVTEQVAKAQKTAAEAQKHSELNRTLIIAVLWVVGIGFATILVTVGAFIQDALANRSATFQNLVNQVNTQNTKSDDLNKKFDLMFQTFIENERQTNQQKVSSSTQ